MEAVIEGHPGNVQRPHNAGAGPAHGALRAQRGPEVLLTSLHLGDEVPHSAQELGGQRSPNGPSLGKDKAHFKLGPGQHTWAPAPVPQPVIKQTDTQ